MQMRKLCASKIEWKYIYQLIQAIENENIRNYVENQIAWCVVKASQYRFYDYTLKLLTVLMPTVVVVLPSPAGVGVMAVTKISLPSGAFVSDRSR